MSHSRLGLGTLRVLDLALASRDLASRIREESKRSLSGDRLPLLSRSLLSHGFGALPAPGGSSLFCFDCIALQVTVFARNRLRTSVKDFFGPSAKAALRPWEPGRSLASLSVTRAGRVKATLLNLLGHAIPDSERIVVIGDTAELRIQKPNVLAAECQTDTFKARISFDDLLRPALCWRLVRFTLGDVRRAEARTPLDSFNTSYAGSLAEQSTQTLQKRPCIDSPISS